MVLHGHTHLVIVTLVVGNINYTTNECMRINRTPLSIFGVHYCHAYIPYIERHTHLSEMVLKTYLCADW